MRRARPLSAPAASGRITNFSETDDGRFLITLTGVCRFDIAEELTVATPYRQVVARLRPLARRTCSPTPAARRAQGRPARVLRAYFDRHGIEADWNAIEAAPLAGLVTSLCMICPFEPEREAGAARGRRTSTRQARLLIALMEMEALAEPGGSSARH